MHPLYSVPMFLTSLACMAFGTFVLLNHPRETKNQLFFILSFSVSSAKGIVLLVF